MMMDKSVLNRVLKGIGANVYAQGVTLIIQIASIPMFLYVWNIGEYGDWILLSAAPAYFSMADVGVVSVAINQMTIFVGRNQNAIAQKIFSSAILFLLMVFAFLSISLLAVLCLVPNSWINIVNWKLVSFFLIESALLGLFYGLFDAVCRAEKKYPIGVFMVNTARLTEWIFGLIFLMINRSFVSVAAGMLCGKIISLLVCWVLCIKWCRIFKWNLEKGSLDRVKVMLKPALAFMAFPIGNALSIQGVTIVVGLVFGNSIVAAFNAYRTISRSVIQAVSLISHSLWPEFSRLYGANEIVYLEKLFKSGLRISSVITVFASVIMFFLMPVVLKIWTSGKIEYISEWSMLFMVITLFGGLWHVPRILLLAINKHISISINYIGAAFVLLTIVWCFGSLYGMDGVLMSMALFEIYMLIACYPPRKKLFSTN